MSHSLRCGWQHRLSDTAAGITFCALVLIPLRSSSALCALHPLLLPLCLCTISLLACTATSPVCNQRRQRTGGGRWRARLAANLVPVAFRLLRIGAPQWPIGWLTMFRRTKSGKQAPPPPSDNADDISLMSDSDFEEEREALRAELSKGGQQLANPAGAAVDPFENASLWAEVGLRGSACSARAPLAGSWGGQGGEGTRSLAGSLLAAAAHCRHRRRVAGR